MISKLHQALYLQLELLRCFALEYFKSAFLIVCDEVHYLSHFSELVAEEKVQHFPS
jgi:hypothetical protein